MTQPLTRYQCQRPIEALDYFQVGIDMRQSPPGSVKVHPGECLREWQRVNPSGILWAERKEAQP